MAKQHHISISNAVIDWVQDNDLQHEEIDHYLFVKWATDVIRMAQVPSQLSLVIGLIEIENSRGELPANYDTTLQAAANVFPRTPCDCARDPEAECCKKGYVHPDRLPKTRRENIVQWVQGTLEKDCELEINLICPTCHKSSCDCGTPAVEVEVDRIWEMAHPEIYYRHHTRIGRFGYGPQPGSYYSPKFQLMDYATNDFHRLNHILTDCPNVNCKDCIHTFRIDLPYIEVDFEEGEVLISYLAKKTDENGDLMIPDHPDLLEAIGNHLDYKWYNRKWKRRGDQNARVIAREALQDRERNLGLARESLDMPEWVEFRAWMDKNWFQRMPKFHHDNDVNKPTANEYEKYSRLLEGHDQYKR